LNYLKQLAGQTAVYGLGIVIPRLLNFLLLTPFYTRIFGKAEYGIITELYAYVVFLMVILTYGMETGYFRYADKNHNKQNVYRSALYALSGTSMVFILLTTIFSGQIARAIDYPAHNEYIIYIGIIVGLDAFTAIPFARLRLENKAIKYAFVRIFEVIINIGANWLFLYFCPRHSDDYQFVKVIYNPGIGVGYVFISNLLSSIFKVIALSKEILIIGGKFEIAILKKMLIYSFPLLIAGLAGTINEALDRVLLKHLIPIEKNPMEQLGIYGANYKLAVLMTLFIQMFRYAAEPFFFSKKDEINAKRIYAVVMNYFVFSGMAIFLLVMLFIDKFKLFIGADFREGISIAPIILMANLFVGIFFNLSIWYKLTNKTMYGAYLVMLGACLTILVNYFFVPVYGYYAAAWGHVISYSVMVVLSFIYGQKYFTIPYDVKRILLYIIIAFTLYLISLKLNIDSMKIKYLINSILILTYFSIFYLIEKRKILINL
jgi:O-antigen/teichoic acid export membrane protein